MGSFRLKPEQGSLRPTPRMQHMHAHIITDMPITQTKFPLDNQKNNLDKLHKSINILSPLSILDRGYSIILNEKGSAIKSSNDVNKGDTLKARLSKGIIDLKVK